MGVVMPRSVAEPSAFEAGPRLMISRFRCKSSDAGLVLTGEVDIATAPLLESALSELVATTTGDLRLECAPLTFIDSSGLKVLAQLQLRLHGRRVVLTNLRTDMRAIFEITALDQVLDLE
jgi:anti-anti-sigma factor